MKTRNGLLIAFVTIGLFVLGSCQNVEVQAISNVDQGSLSRAATTISWAGHTWSITTGSMAGNNTGSANNVWVDGSGWLHLRINNSGGWKCAELFTTDRMGFGTYQWQVEGAIDKLDKNVVLGLFPYGPVQTRTNEIDIEYARWGNSAWNNGNYTVFPASGTTVGSTTFPLTLSGTYTTQRFKWSNNQVQFWNMGGFQPIGTTNNVINSWTYAPGNPSVNIPQGSFPLGMNLWLFSGLAPSNGQGVEIIIHSFQKI